MTDYLRARLSLTISGKAEHVPVRSLSETLANALVVLSDIDAQVSSIDDGSLEWRIVAASTGSPLTIQMEAYPRVAADYGERVVSAFFDGLSFIEEARSTKNESPVPAYFTPRAMDELERMNRQLDNGVVNITFSDQHRRFSPSRRFIDNVAAVVRKPAVLQAPERRDHFEVGAIEGTIENLIGHNELYFSLYDVLTKERVRCNFDARLQEHVRAAWQSRVVVEGRIKHGPDGVPKSMEVSRIVERPSMEGLPQFKDFSVDITGGIESSEFVRGLRDD